MKLSHDGEVLPQNKVRAFLADPSCRSNHFAEFTIKSVAKSTTRKIGTYTYFFTTRRIARFPISRAYASKSQKVEAK